MAKHNATNHSRVNFNNSAPQGRFPVVARNDNRIMYLMSFSVYLYISQISAGGGL